MLSHLKIAFSSRGRFGRNGFRRGAERKGDLIQAGFMRTCAKGAFMDETNIENLRTDQAVWETDKIGIDGMNCEQCVQTIEKALGAVRGVKEVHVNLDENSATVIYDNRRTNIPELHDALLQSGYTPSAKEAE
jgi:copper ion binding protein